MDDMNTSHPHYSSFFQFSSTNIPSIAFPSSSSHHFSSYFPLPILFVLFSLNQAGNSLGFDLLGSLAAIGQWVDDMDTEDEDEDEGDEDEGDGEGDGMEGEDGEEGDGIDEDKGDSDEEDGDQYPSQVRHRRLLLFVFVG